MSISLPRTNYATSKKYKKDGNTKEVENSSKQITYVYTEDEVTSSKRETDGEREVEVKSSVSLSVPLAKKLNTTYVSRVVFAGEDGVT